MHSKREKAPYLRQRSSARRSQREIHVQYGLELELHRVPVRGLRVLGGTRLLSRAGVPVSAPSWTARGTVTRASRPRRGHPPPHRPRPRVTDASSEGQESARSRPEPQGASGSRTAPPGGSRAADEARTASARPCPKRARRYPPWLDGLSVCPSGIPLRCSALRCSALRCSALRCSALRRLSRCQCHPQIRQGSH